MRPPLCALWLLSLAGASVAQGSPDAPTPANFILRYSPQVATLGDYLYIDGGEISRRINGKPGPRAETVNKTLSLPLDKSWSSDTVSIRTIDKPAPKLVGNALWPTPDGRAFYSWAGYSKGGVEVDKLKPDTIWKFTADGEGGGSWSKTSPSNREEYANYELSENAACTAVQGKGFCFGGMGSATAQPGREKAQAIPGIVSFDMEDKVFGNDTSSVAVFPFGTLVHGEAVFVPTFGPNGLITVLGGASFALKPNSAPVETRDFGNVTFYDPVEKTWFWQGTTGDPPTPRERFCAVGVQSDTNTFEIFVFGGVDRHTKKDFGDLHVLSLPSFRWHKLDVTSRPRRSHSCVVVGKRQLLSVGGIQKDDWETKDEFPQGLGILDLSAPSSWRTSYSSHEPDYKSPPVVKMSYNRWSEKDVDWSSDEVRQLFATANDNPDDNDNDSGNGSEGTNVGAIAGGVVGGVAGLAALIAVGIFLVRRRKRRLQESQPHSAGDEGYLAADGTDKDKQGVGAMSELDGSALRHEAPAGEAVVDGSPANPVELDAGPQSQRA